MQYARTFYYYAPFLWTTSSVASLRQLLQFCFPLSFPFLPLVPLCLCFILFPMLMLSRLLDAFSLSFSLALGSHYNDRKQNQLFYRKPPTILPPLPSSRSNTTCNYSLPGPRHKPTHAQNMLSSSPSSSSCAMCTRDRKHKHRLNAAHSGLACQREGEAAQPFSYIAFPATFYSWCSYSPYFFFVLLHAFLCLLNRTHVCLSCGFNSLRLLFCSFIRVFVLLPTKTGFYHRNNEN